MNDEGPDSPSQKAPGVAGPTRLANAVVLMVECQREYVTGRLPLVGVGRALDACALLLARAREAGTPIIHIIQKGQPGAVFDLATSGGEIEERAASQGDELVIEKTLPNSFSGTRLDAIIKETGRDGLIVAGFMTHTSVGATVVVALGLGYRTTIVSEATATRNVHNPAAGGVIDAASLQLASLAALSERSAKIVHKVEQLR